MPVPPKCRYYQDDGTPIRNGCFRRDTCSFVHPSEPNWDIAPRRDPVKDGERGSSFGRGRGRERGGAPPSRPFSGRESLSWGAPPSSASELPLEVHTGQQSSSGAGWESVVAESGAREKPNNERHGWDQSNGGWGATSSSWDSSSWSTSASGVASSSQGMQVDKPSSFATGSGTGWPSSSDGTWNGAASKSDTQGGKKSSEGRGKTSDNSSGWSTSSWKTEDVSRSRQNQADESTSLAPESGFSRRNSTEGDGDEGGPKNETRGRKKTSATWQTTDDTSSDWNSPSRSALNTSTSEWPKQVSDSCSVTSGSRPARRISSDTGGGTSNSKIQEQEKITAGWSSSDGGVAARSGGWNAESGWGTGGGWGTDDSSRGERGTPWTNPNPSRMTSEKKDLPVMNSEEPSSRIDPLEIVADDSIADLPRVVPPRAISPTVNKRSTGIEKSTVARPPSPDETLPFRSRVIRALSDAIGKQIELNECQSDWDRWAVAQNSVRFTRVGQSARNKLNVIREDRDAKLLETKKSLEFMISSLTEFPETTRSSVMEFNPDLDEKALIQYTSDLKEWVETVRKHLIMVTAPPMQRLAPTVPVWYDNHGADNPPPAKRQRSDSSGSLHSKTNVTRNEFISQIGDLEDRMEEAVERLEEIRTVPAHPDYNNAPEAVRTNFDLPVGDDELDRQTTIPNPILDLSARADSLGDELGKQAERAASVFSKVYHQNQLLQELNDANDGYKLLRAQLQDQLAQFEQSRLLHSEQIRTISEQVQRLHARRAHTPKLASSLVEEDVLSRVDSTVNEILREELLPVLEGIRIDCSNQVEQSNQQIYTDAWKTLQPSLAMADHIHQCVEQANTEIRE